MNEPVEVIEAESGMVFLCQKSNRKQGTKSGKFYLYDCGKLKTYTTRNVTMLFNGDELLAQPGAFAEVRRCPFCNLLAPEGTPLHQAHDTIDCAAEWDAKVKKYCRECSGDKVNGKCPKCDDGE